MSGNSRLIVNKMVLGPFDPTILELETMGQEAGVVHNPYKFELFQIGQEIGVDHNPFTFELFSLGIEIGVVHS